jgi:hypothetical protein
LRPRKSGEFVNSVDQGPVPSLHGSIDLSPVRNSIEPKLRFLSWVLRLLCRISDRLLRRIHAEHLDGLELPLMFCLRFLRLIRRGDFLKDKELTRKNVKRGIYLEATNPANSSIAWLGRQRRPGQRAGAEWQKAQADPTSECRLGRARDEN